MFVRTPGVRDDVLSLGEAKARVQREIEQQRAVIEQYDRSEAARIADGEPGDARWYERESEKLSRLKDELYQLRLRGGEFFVRGQSNASMILEVAVSGRITLYERADAPRTGTVGGNSVPSSATPAPPLPMPALQPLGSKVGLSVPTVGVSKMALYVRDPMSPALSNTDLADPSEQARLAGLAFRKRIHVMYINSLVKVRPADNANINLGGLQIGSSDKLVRLDFKSNSTVLAVTDAEELLQVLGSHLSRYNHHKVSQVRRLIELHELKVMPFSRFCPHNESLLHRLWHALLPHEAPELRNSEGWAILGFQSKDPSSDFRGMGMLGLHNLVYFAEVHTRRCQEMALGSRAYPFAAVGINVTQMCCTLLNLTEEVVRLPPSDSKWDTPALTFFSYVENEHAFEELYCFAFELLDLIFVKTHAEYMDFPAVYDRVQLQIKDMLENRHPLAFEELRGFIDWAV